MLVPDNNYIYQKSIYCSVGGELSGIKAGGVVMFVSRICVETLAHFSNSTSAKLY